MITLLYQCWIDSHVDQICCQKCIQASRISLFKKTGTNHVYWLKLAENWIVKKVTFFQENGRLT